MIDKMQKTVLKANSISKAFLNVKAVNNISFAVEQGDIYAFLGPNGAGKTTTLRMLLDIIKPDSGHIEWNLNGKQNLLPDAEHIGYLPEERGLYLDIPILKSLVYLATIRGMEKTHAKKAALEWMERLGLADRAKEKLQVLSKGNQQKIQFVASILHKPEFAILDEPFSGLDPLNQEIFIDFIKEINNQGTTILLSAHQMSLVEKVANKLFLINNGKEVYNGSLSGIYQSFGEKIIIELQLESPFNETTFQNLKGVDSVIRVDDFRAKITYGPQSSMKNVLHDLTKIDGICDITSHKPDLHEIFLQLVKKQ
ncbi:ABC transporter ATP-binding protein [Parapedobacter tibetensis]|uniref:ABC transporter ATP-binding protein n=1 Tax=Parapedobacter tibetensis TaxID=2972951 RepID=UPI00214D9305|nr:ATP-binding cassette domain-containing protein [Parapedobacter tibetensis]